MDPNIISDSSLLIPSSSPIASSSSYNLNFKTIFLFVILLCACCMLSIGYNFEINNLFNFESMSFWASLMLILFLFYVLYEFFKSDTCEDLDKSGWDRLKSSASRGRSYMGEQGTIGVMAMGNAMNTASQRITNPYANSMSNKLNAYVQPKLAPQYQNTQYMSPQNPNPPII
jgi:hypothetical protein